MYMTSSPAPRTNVLEIEALALRYRSVLHVLKEVPGLAQRVSARRKLVMERQEDLRDAFHVIGEELITSLEDEEWFEDVFEGAKQVWLFESEATIHELLK